MPLTYSRTDPRTDAETFEPDPGFDAVDQTDPHDALTLRMGEAVRFGAVEFLADRLGVPLPTGCYP